MSQIRFNKSRTPKNVEETTITKPELTYTADNTTEKKKKRKKTYSTIRVEKEKVHKLNALQNSLGFNTQNEFLDFLLDGEKENLTGRQRTMYNMYMDTYEARDRRKK